MEVMLLSMSNGSKMIKKNYALMVVDMLVSLLMIFEELLCYNLRRLLFLYKMYVDF